jgi:hypothetical protein
MDGELKRGLLDLILCPAILAWICSTCIAASAESGSPILCMDPTIRAEETVFPEFFGTDA